MRGYVGVTDYGWYEALQLRPHLDEVNFWRPGTAPFRVLPRGGLFFFKLKAPHNAIAGFGQFARFERMPLWLAWEVFGEANGVASERALVERLGRLARSSGRDLRRETSIGCIFVAFPIFFAPDDWVEPPSDWKSNVVSGAGYDLASGEGLRIWQQCAERATRQAPAEFLQDAGIVTDRYGAPISVKPRLGQRSFRMAVLQAYGSACAVTTEHSLPVLDAAHIKPYGDGGLHAVSNGLPLRKDLHRLFDLGYVTVRPDATFAVSGDLRDEYANGKTYYALSGRRVQLPNAEADRPDPDLLAWHGEEVYRG
jgi:putative restriction endonuclease